MTWIVADLWRSTSVVIDSVLPVEVVRSRVNEGVRAYRTARRELSWGERTLLPREIEVRGGSGPNWVELDVVRPMSRGGSLGHLKGQIVQVGTGSRVLGTYGCVPFARRFLAIYLVFSVLFWVIAAVATVLSPQLIDSLLLITPLMFFFVGCGLAASSVRESRNVRGFLMAWFQDRIGQADSSA